MTLELEWKKQLRKFGPVRVTDAPLVRQIASEIYFGATQYIYAEDIRDFISAANKLGVSVKVFQ